ncbi:phosphate signaling complex protein PhoU [Paenibacillus sp. LjRoot153]|uniref:Phosphate-specific transport system accessory protein PhoU n=1 Tax=Paenibacillus allorhizoplanae TaxID=2905648 RepID=A0ABM9C0N6_9BACL|nr:MULTISPECIES: phosphate signaling complex protein PhoU [Paenibacillus]KRE70031.1 PhoU family transcriptional regulator [Paenibacillus sp. Soil750]CAH1200037.1 Phosphate-specific transport system accessory protein PhoU [Paenibacillus allorhizoplanae]
MDARPGFHQSLALLQKELQQMGESVEDLIYTSVESLAKLDEKAAQQVIQKDDLIDDYLTTIDELCLRLIALQQPMASDLRIIGTALKIATDLERIADHAVDIAKITIRFAGEELVKPLEVIPQMAEIAIEMLHESLLSYTERDVHRAASLAEKDDRVDKLYSTVMQELMGMMGTDYHRNRQLTHLLFVAHFLERVADHTTNIGEGVIYMVTGKRKDLNV